MTFLLQVTLRVTLLLQVTLRVTVLLRVTLRVTLLLRVTLQGTPPLQLRPDSVQVLRPEDHVGGSSTITVSTLLHSFGVFAHFYTLCFLCSKTKAIKYFVLLF